MELFDCHFVLFDKFYLENLVKGKDIALLSGCLLFKG